MPNMEKVIKEFEHLLNAAKGNYQDFVDLTIDGGEEILALLKEQEAVVRCKDCKHGRVYDGDLVACEFMELSRELNWFCADGERKDGE